MPSKAQLITSIIALTLILGASIYGDSRKLDAKVLSQEYDKCMANIPLLRDSEYKEALKECMNNARVIARAAVR